MSYAETGVACHISLPLPELRQAFGSLVREAAPSVAGELAQRNGLKGKRILIVEDEPLIAMVLTDYLDDAGCEIVGPAQSVGKAKALANDEAIDAALVDGNLAGKPVDEIASALSEREIPFAFVTGYGRDSLPPGYADAPIVEKPFTQDQVVTALERLFSNVVTLPVGRREP
ncbi:MAG: response regulator [Caulobacteraceae bacterium]